MKTKPLFLIAALLLTTTVLATAKGLPSKGKGGPPPLPADVIAKYDTDGNGTLSDTEKAAMKAALEAERKALIAKYDVNGDGVLDATERAALEAAMKAQRLAEQTAKFATLDADSSGGLTLAEFTVGAPTGATAAQISACFTRLDTDKDALISLAEFVAEPTKPAPPAGKPGSKPSGKPSGTSTTASKK